MNDDKRYLLMDLNLQSDNFKMGGGIHRTKKDGHLNIHCDFNKHEKTGKCLLPIARSLVYHTLDIV